MILVPFNGFRQRLDGIAKLLSPLGEVNSTDLDTETGRSISFAVSAPGYGLPAGADFEYRERFHRTSSGWLRVRYFYEYRPRRPPSRRAHHDHAPQGVHQHCRSAGLPTRATHFRDIPRVLEQVHEEFAGQFSSATEIDCGGLQALP